MEHHPQIEYYSQERHTSATTNDSILTRFWWTESLRGIVSLAFGALYFALYNFRFAIVYLLGAYLVLDGCIDLYRAIANNRVPHHHLHIYLGGIVSIGIGVLCFLIPAVTLIGLGILFALRIIERGFQVCGEARRSQRSHVGLRWLYGILLMLIGLVLLWPPVLVAFGRLLILFIGVYALWDGCYMLGRGLRLRHTASRGALATPAQQAARLDIPADLPPTTRRALIFVRRSGASGLGHVGWAFEWRNGWFNVGAVENRSGRTFSKAEATDFWTAHTTDPVATMQSVGGQYGEYKVLYVTQPHPKAAWRTVVWVSQRPYAVLRRNCVDATYDVLRTYGITNLPDPATEYAPNDWYDSLATPSYAIATYPLIPLHLHKASRRPLATREIVLTIPARIIGTIPAWRERGLRGLTEITLAWDKMLDDVKSSVTSVGKVVARC